MSAPLPLYQTLLQRISAAVPATVRRSAVTRLALLVTGILAAKSTVLAQLAAELDALALTAATTPESIERRLRRTLNDPHLVPHTCYAPVLRQVLDWDQLLRGSRQVVLSLDDSTKTDHCYPLTGPEPTAAQRPHRNGERLRQCRLLVGNGVRHREAHPGGGVAHFREPAIGVQAECP